MRALIALLNFGESDLRRRPASTLADVLAVDLSVAHRHIAALKGAKLVERIGRYGVRVLAPEQGWTFHRHDKRGFCLGRCSGVMLEAASIHHVVSDHFEPGFDVCCTYKVGEQMSLRNSIREIKGKIELHEKKRGRMSTSSRTALLLLSHYTKARRRASGSYAPTAGDKKKAAKVVKNLASRLIGPDLFGRYMEHAFDVFPRIVKGPKAPKFPPVAFLSSETIIDGFAATLGRRKMDVDKAAAMMEKCKIAADPGIAVMIARNCHEDGIEIPTTISDELREGVEFVLNHFAEIGYKPEED